MFQNLTGWHALVILAVVVLLFGATKLPALARSVGQSVRILKRETATESPDPAAPDAAAGSASAHAAAGSAGASDTVRDPDRLRTPVDTGSIG